MLVVASRFATAEAHFACTAFFCVFSLARQGACCRLMTYARGHFNSRVFNAYLDLDVLYVKYGHISAQGLTR